MPLPLPFRIPLPGPILAPILILALVLAGCETAEERAEKHYQSALALFEAGDADRALVELRNVFKLNGTHKAARLAYAETMEERGDLGQAIRHYRLAAEQYPDEVGAHAALGRLTIAIRDWDSATFHAGRAYELAPGDPQNRALYASVRFREGDREDAVKMAREVLGEDPGNLLAHTLVISEALQAEDYDTAHTRTDVALGHNPTDRGLHAVKLSVLNALGDTAGVGAHLTAMVDLFPEDTSVADNLIRWHLDQGDAATAERMLRARADGGGTEEALAVVRFLMAQSGNQAARDELDRLIAVAGPEAAGRDRFVRTRAAVDFEMGNREQALAALRGLIADAAPSDEVRLSQVTLAKMLNSLGRVDEGAALVEAVLETDPDMVEALKMRAAALTEADQTDAAIRDLRRALDQAPRDAEVLTLMAVAHEREGAHELAGERLALAVEASGNAPAESLRYTRFLIAADRFGPAESVLIDALRRAPEHPQLLEMLGRVHLARRDFERVGQVARLLADQNTETATDLANGLRTASLRAQQKTGETIAFLEGLVGRNSGDIDAAIPLIQSYLREGRFAEARETLAGLAGADPDQPAIRAIRAGIAAVAGETAEAETLYRGLIADNPAIAQPYLPLYRLLLGEDGRAADAAALLDDGIAATGGHPQLLLVKAGALERAGDIEGAIAIYEGLYARDSANPIFANNLASLIATHRPGAADLERAFTIARRLRGTDVPPFQDTYGWILARRGDYAEAIPYLEPAAAALAQDPLVQFHLGMAYAGAGRRTKAIETLTRALDVAGPDSPLPQMAEARAKLEELEAAPQQ